MWAAPAFTGAALPAFQFMLELEFQSGTILLRDPAHPDAALPQSIAALCVYDPREQCWRAAAQDYAEIVTPLYRNGIDYCDHAKAFAPLSLTLHSDKHPRDYQREAIDAWEGCHRRGVVVLPTGTGKSFLAQLAILRAARPALVVVPTLDLLAQWALQLRSAFRCSVGLLGGGSHDLQPITVATYDSAQMRMDQIGNRFGLLVVDECHHLPGAVYSQLAKFSIAPYRLGLTATPERMDGLDSLYGRLLGPICYRREITDLPECEVLSPYDTITLETQLDSDEQDEYRRAHECYINFVRQNRIDFSSPRGWGIFLQSCFRMPGGREALDAYLAQKRIARTSRAKLRQLWELIKIHRHDRVIIFTADNATAYQIGNLFRLPVITHHTRSAERCAFLSGFRDGLFQILVTSKVLNEGVDVPAANIGIVMSGSGSIREHVQRLGRILRPAPEKTALLYELVSTGTSETYVSERRRQHCAFDALS